MKADAGDGAARTECRPPTKASPDEERRARRFPFRPLRRPRAGLVVTASSPEFLGHFCPHVNDHAQHEHPDLQAFRRNCYPCSRLGQRASLALPCSSASPPLANSSACSRPRSHHESPRQTDTWVLMRLGQPAGHRGRQEDRFRERSVCRQGWYSAHVRWAQLLAS